MSKLKTPGLYIDEFSFGLNSIQSMETAIPAFIGYTEKAMLNDVNDLYLKPIRIRSLMEYQNYFGNAFPEECLEVDFDLSNPLMSVATANVNPSRVSNFVLYYSLQMFYDNGGGDCYIVSVGNYVNSNGTKYDIVKNDFILGLDAVKDEFNVTLIAMPDALYLSSALDYYFVFKNALLQCETNKDRFVVFDVWKDKVELNDNINTLQNADLGSVNQLKYGATYYPCLFVNIDYYYTDESKVFIKGILNLNNLNELKNNDLNKYNLAKNAISNLRVLLPATPAVLGVYVSVDRSRGVWKAPSNVSLNNVIKPEVVITDQMQDQMYVNVMSGKSINAIRYFNGRGNLVWGARTLAGNDNQWRYISVCRFCMHVECSIKIGIASFVFEPNSIQTWQRIKSMIENYLFQLWREGALAGATTKDAFFVNIGLNQTMNVQDILEGRLIIELGLAVVRPQEFLIIRIEQKMSEQI